MGQTFLYSAYFFTELGDTDLAGVAALEGIADLAGVAALEGVADLVGVADLDGATITKVGYELGCL